MKNSRQSAWAALTKMAKMAIVMGVVGLPGPLRGWI